MNALTNYEEMAAMVLFGIGLALPDFVSVTSMRNAHWARLVNAGLDDPDRWILVDYKSDRLEREDAFRKRYAVQLALYKRAVEQITGRPVSETYIYSLHLQKEIRI